SENSRFAQFFFSAEPHVQRRVSRHHRAPLLSLFGARGAPIGTRCLFLHRTALHRDASLRTAAKASPDSSKPKRYPPTTFHVAESYTRAIATNSNDHARAAHLFRPTRRPLPHSCTMATPSHSSGNRRKI